MSERGGYESMAVLVVTCVIGVGGYIRDSQSATELAVPGMCFTVKLKLCKRTRQRTTMGT